MTFAKYIKKLRVESGLSQAEVADRLGYKNAQFVSNWERGIAGVPVKHLSALARIFKKNQKDIYAAALDDAQRQIEKRMS